MNHHVRRTQMGNQQRQQRLQMLFGKLIPKNTYEFNRRGFHHGSHSHIRLLQLRQDMRRKELHDVDPLIDLTDPILRALGFDTDSQHQMNGHVFIPPLVGGIGVEGREHLRYVFGAYLCGLGFELAAHGAKEFLGAFASGFGVGAFHVGEDEFLGVVFEAFFVYLPNHQIGNHDPGKNLPQRRLLLKQLPMHQLPHQTAQKPNPRRGQRIVLGQLTHPQEQIPHQRRKFGEVR
mmetsp:Transcript_29430/g.61902  ORF Transcript_29430/g.61902 Transcript_29430/m.61902 type:complete len:233 (-) Transcript_29430:1015-1713(-)